MTVSTFKRGLKLNTHKHATEGKAVEQAPLPKQVVIPINQHFGAPNKALVSVGDRVRRGQVIADGMAPGPMTVPVHASISGVVKKIEPRPQSNNAEGLCVIIEADPAAIQEEDLFMPPGPLYLHKGRSLPAYPGSGDSRHGGGWFPSACKTVAPAQ